MRHRRKLLFHFIPIAQMVLFLPILIKTAFRMRSWLEEQRSPRSGDLLKESLLGNGIVDLFKDSGGGFTLMHSRRCVSHPAARGSLFVSVDTRSQEAIGHLGGRRELGTDGLGQISFEGGEQQFTNGFHEHDSGVSMGMV
eukprot:jgi/Psemu1/310005/fgenesh1_kg.577_\